MGTTQLQEMALGAGGGGLHRLTQFAQPRQVSWVWQGEGMFSWGPGTTGLGAMEGLPALGTMLWPLRIRMETSMPGTPYF